MVHKASVQDFPVMTERTRLISGIYKKGAVVKTHHFFTKRETMRNGYLQNAKKLNSAPKANPSNMSNWMRI